jgi:UDP:flavonoid glycosyltransferase YjiC (YdhE family)
MVHSRVRVLFVAFSGDGHVRALLPLARAATQAGHEVVFATGADSVGVVFPST